MSKAPGQVLIEEGSVDIQLTPTRPLLIKISSTVADQIRSQDDPEKGGHHNQQEDSYRRLTAVIDVSDLDMAKQVVVAEFLSESFDSELIGDGEGKFYVAKTSEIVAIGIMSGRIEDKGQKR